MQYTVVHSKDPYLLARLATDLQMEGYWIYEYVEWAHPFDTEPNIEYAAINDPFYNIKNLLFHNHDCEIDEPAIRHELTSRNYIKVLTQILEP